MSSYDSELEMAVDPTILIRTPVQTITILAMLAFGGFTLLLLLLCLVCCYRRKSTEDVNEYDMQSRKSIEEPKDRTITFGEMPSHRDERQRERNNRHVFGALDRIREVDERSKGSGSIPSSQLGSLPGSIPGSLAGSHISSGRSYLSEGHGRGGHLQLSRPRDRRCYSSSQIRNGNVFCIDMDTVDEAPNGMGRQSYESVDRTSSSHSSTHGRRMRKERRQRETQRSRDSIPVQIDGPSRSYPSVSPHYPQSLPSPLYPTGNGYSISQSTRQYPSPSYFDRNGRPVYDVI